ncbi:aminoglycoside phosphotransferase (plasmid) [Deinococcus geothermalis DSM 11300]|uniref:Aminoglycoside phosphotransferase n=1 Tax=Deinococcus geothermalis (strain DSM 11300 / CIP 105573 / AG-3a) TaxID=319795 RepID=Q1J3L5_DEIGD|nr:phosphotransferase [Deinococcus geothermalis]ABF43919.1 aminoglycoside phosphotransferase [Deinococcus geothermalis DSM 11300]
MSALDEVEKVLWDHYGLRGPFEVTALAAEGRNNSLVAFRSPGGAFVWKQGSSALAPVQQREFALLAWLAEQDLPFRMAAPLRTLAGAWGWEGGRGLNVLLPLLPGERLPETADAWHALGTALNALHAALARFPLEGAPRLLDWAKLGDLHPRVPDPLALSFEQPDLWGDEATLHSWRLAFGEMLWRVRDAYAALPHQVVHGDFNSVNVLFGGGGVSAVLDFEFACPGPRLLDVATALSEVLVRPEPEWALAQAFLRGYGQLTLQERAALPAALLLRQAAVGVWGLGLALEDGPNATTQARLRELGTVSAWLKTQGDRLSTG